MTQRSSQPETEPRILVADDDPLIVELICGWLKSAGYDVIDATNSGSALQACISAEPSLAIIDYEMPGYCGADLARFVHSQTGVGMIFLSAHREAKVIDEAIAAGALAYLMKPVNEEQLLAAVRTALQRARELRALRAQTDNLGKALQTSRTVSIATGLLMGRLRLTQQEAFERLRQHARSRRKKLEDVAAELVQATDETARLFSCLSLPPSNESTH